MKKGGVKSERSNACRREAKRGQAVKAGVKKKLAARNFREKKGAKKRTLVMDT